MSTMEELIDAVGGCGKSTFIFVSCVYSSKIIFAWSMMQMTFSGLVPDWYCVTPELPNVTGSELTNTSHWKTCDVNGTTCESYVFTGPSRTIINEWNLICDMRWAKPTVTSVQMTGVLIGAVLAGYLGDRFGRKKIFFALMLLHSLSNFVAAFSVSWQMFGAVRFVLGLAIGGLTVVCYTFCIEVLPVRWRPILSVIPAWVLGTCMLAGAASLLQNWSHLHIVCGFMGIPTLLAWFIVPESIRWLSVHNRIDEAMGVLRKMAETNGKKVPQKARSVLEGIAKEEEELRVTNKQYTYLDLVKERKVATATVLVCFDWFAMSLIYYGISFGVASFSGNFFVNLTILTALDAPMMLVSFWLVNRIGRRWTSVLYFVLACGAAVGCLVVELIGSADRGLMLNILCTSSKVMVSSGWCAIQTWGVELYPTVIRNLGYGAHNTAARVGGIVAPFLINLDDMKVVSYVVVAVLCFLVTMTTFVLPETKGKCLADSLKSSSSEAPKVKVDTGFKKVPNEICMDGGKDVEMNDILEVESQDVNSAPNAQDEIRKPPVDDDGETEKAGQTTNINNRLDRGVISEADTVVVRL